MKKYSLLGGVGIAAVAAFLLVAWIVSDRPAEAKSDPQPQNQEATRPAQAKTKKNQIVGEVVMVSPIPDPAGADYPDCAARIVVRTSDGDRLCGGAAFQNRQITSFGRVAVGAQVRLRVRAADKVPRAEIARYRLVDETGRFDLDPWWVDRIEVLGAARPRKTADSKVEIADLAAGESAFIRYALYTNPSPMIGGVGNDFFFYGDRKFYRDDFWKEKPEDPNHVGIRDAILQFHEFLAERDIELYVALIPVASSIFPDYAVNQFFDPALHEPPNEPILAMLRDLSKSGVRSVDLTSAFLRQRWTEFEGIRYPIYRPNDTHWGPNGAKLAAAEISRVVRASTAYAQHLDLCPPETFEESSQLMEFEADIVEILSAKYPHWNVEIKPHLTPSHEVSAKGEVKGWLSSHEHPDSAIHLIGDSFVHKLYETNSGIHAHLTRELAAPVNLFYRYSSGGDVIQEWVDSTDLSKAKIVVFATAEKYACFDHLWKPLRAPAQQESSSAAAGEEGSRSTAQ